VRGAVSTENCLNCGEVLTGQHASHCASMPGCGCSPCGGCSRTWRRPPQPDSRIWAHALAARTPPRTPDAGVPAREARALHTTVRMYLVLSVVFSCWPRVGPGSELPCSSTTRREHPAARRRCPTGHRPSAGPSTPAPTPALDAEGPPARGRGREAGAGGPARCPARPNSRRRCRRPPRGSRSGGEIHRRSLQRGEPEGETRPGIERYEGRLREACRKIVADQQGFGARLFDNIPKMMFIFLPLIAAVMPCSTCARAATTWSTCCSSCTSTPSSSSPDRGDPARAPCAVLPGARQRRQGCRGLVGAALVFYVPWICLRPCGACTRRL